MLLTLTLGQDLGVLDHEKGKMVLFPLEGLEVGFGLASEFLELNY